MSFRVTRRAEATWKGTVADGGGRIVLEGSASELLHHEKLKRAYLGA